MIKFVQSLFGKGKSASAEQRSQQRGSTNDDSTIPKRSDNAETIAARQPANRTGAQRNSASKLTIGTVKKTPDSNTRNTATSSAVGTKSVPASQVGSTVPTTTNAVPAPIATDKKLVELKPVQKADAVLTQVQGVARPDSNLAKLGIKLMDIISCPSPAKLNFDTQRSKTAHQRICDRRKQLKQKMVAHREPDEVDRFVLDIPVPVVDDDSPDQSPLDDAQAILCQHRDGNGTLLMTVNNDCDTLYTWYAKQNRLDVVQCIYRDQMTNSSLFDEVDIRSPDAEGQTCLYAFATKFNLEGVRFCVQAASASPQEGWLTAAMAVLSASAWHQPPLVNCEQFLIDVLRSLENGSMHVNDYLPWRRLCLWLPQHITDGQTLLHFACAHCNLPLIKVLIDFGANPMLTTVQPCRVQYNAFEICRECQPAEVREAACQLMTDACRHRGLSVTDQ